MEAPNIGHVYLVDDDASIRLALTTTFARLGYTVNAFESAAEFLKHATPVSPAVLVLDMRMPGQSGVELQADLAHHGWTTPTIFISGESLPIQIVQGMKQGASDFLLKPFSIEDLLLSIRRALDQDRAIHTALIKTLQVEQNYRHLTPRERDILEAILAGNTNKQIATADGSAAATVKLHRARVLQKMQVNSLAELILLFKNIDISKLKSNLS
jgi:FixJ family two-component response regulator